MALPLVLVPGLMCDGATWTPLLSALQGSGQVGSLLLVDHGLCDSLLGMAEQLLADAPPRFALAGHSMGGRVALEVCRLAPERVSHLALLDTGHAPLAAGESGQAEAQKRLQGLEGKLAEAKLSLSFSRGVLAFKGQANTEAGGKAAKQAFWDTDFAAPCPPEVLEPLPNRTVPERPAMACAPSNTWNAAEIASSWITTAITAASLARLGSRLNRRAI
jgi:pimeloyl-ACP methyl ester carboxylesterase